MDEVPKNKTPTATKLNQNPACIRAHGSRDNTATMANNHCGNKGQRSA